MALASKLAAGATLALGLYVTPGLGFPVLTVSPACCALATFVDVEMRDLDAQVKDLEGSTYDFKKV